MNPSVEDLIKTIDLDNESDKLIVLNKDQFTISVVNQLLKQLEAYGIKAIAVLAEGDVRTAVDLYPLKEKK